MMRNSFIIDDDDEEEEEESSSLNPQSGISYESVEAEVDDDDDDGGSAVSSWAAMERLLKNDYIRSEKESLSRRLKRLGLPTLSSVKIVEDIKRWMKPELAADIWSSSVLRNKTLTMILYKKRRQLYEYIIQLGNIYRSQGLNSEGLNSEGLNSERPYNEEVKLTGHHVCGAMGMLQIAIRLDHINLMIKYAANGAVVADTELLKQQSSEIQNSSYLTIPTAVGFKQRFQTLLNKAQWPTGGQTVNSSPVNSADDNNTPTASTVETDFVKRLPAFESGIAPEEFDQEISWENWCRTFDQIHLRIEKNGHLW